MRSRKGAHNAEKSGGIGCLRRGPRDVWVSADNFFNLQEGGRTIQGYHHPVNGVPHFTNLIQNCYTTVKKRERITRILHRDVQRILR